MGNNLHVTGNVLVDGTLAVGASSVFTGTVDLAGGALNTDPVTNFNADLLDGAELSTDGTLADNSDTAVPTEKAVKTYADNLAGAGRTTETVKANADAIAVLDAAAVKLTGDQEIAGVKTLSGKMIPQGGLRAVNSLQGSMTQDVAFDALSPFIPNVNDEIWINGGGIIQQTTFFIWAFSRAVRSTTDAIRLYGARTDGSTYSCTYSTLTNGSSTLVNLSICW